MAKQKAVTSLQANVDPVIEAKVDAMMEPEKPEKPQTAPKPQPTPPKATEPLDVFAGQASPLDGKATEPATAPLLPSAAPQPKPEPESEVKPEPAPAPEPKPVVEPAPKPVSTPTEELPKEPEIAPLNIDTPESDAAIADIVTQEADEVLAAQDAGILAAADAAETAPEPAPKHGHPLFWFMVVLLVIIAAVAAWVLTSPGLSPSL